MLSDIDLNLYGSGRQKENRDAQHYHACARLCAAALIRDKSDVEGHGVGGGNGTRPSAMKGAPLPEDRRKGLEPARYPAAGEMQRCLLDARWAFAIFNSSPIVHPDYSISLPP